MNAQETITCSEAVQSETRGRANKLKNLKMRTAKHYSIGLIAIIVFTIPPQTFAQMADFYSSPGYSTLINSLITNEIWNASMSRYTKQGTRRNSGDSRSASSRQVTQPEVPAYRRYPVVQFKSTGTRLTLQEYLDSVNISPQDKAELKELVLGIFKKYESEAAAKGYPNDWALAYVSYVGLNSHVYHGKTDKPIILFEQNIGLRDVVAEFAADNGIFNNVTDRKKQELYELLVMLGGLTYHFYEKARAENNAEELKNAQIAAAHNLKLVGIKP
jgi:hypothetical protein